MDFREKYKTISMTLLVAMGFSMFIETSQAAPNKPLAEGDEETVTLTLGTTDNELYGRNYGRDKNNFRLDVMFTPTPDAQHQIQWQAFDIEENEMEVFLNDVKIKTLSQTSADQLGPVDQLTVPAFNLGLGMNVLSFRVNSGDETWGITNLRVDAVDEPDPDEAATTVLLDAPDELRYGSSTRSYSFNFDFTPRGPYYQETILFEFDTRLRNGTRNGFDVRLNGSIVFRIPTFIGRATSITRRFSLDKSELRVGSNTLVISTTSTSSVFNSETQIAKVKIESRSEPQADISVVGLRFAEEQSSKGQVDLIAGVTNVGVVESLEKEIAFYRSENEDLSDPVLLIEEPLAMLAVGEFIEVLASVSRSEVKRGQFYWACVQPIDDEVDNTNDCSPPIVATNSVVMAPIIMLLND